MRMNEREDTIERLKRDLELIRKKREEIIREDTIERLERVLKMTKKSITVTIPKLTAERAVSMLKEHKNEYKNGFNDAMLGKQEMMYEGTDGKWHKKDW